MRRTGLKVIELRALIAIIAVLAAGLCPVFGRAREKARATTRLSNLKQAGTALMMYPLDYDGTMPSVSFRNDYFLSSSCPVGTQLAQSPPPPPGRLVDIGGRKLHLQCSGKGSPTVILMAGGGAYSIDWALVQPKVAGSTRVCSYDRAGLAWSDPGPADETVEQTIGDLHALLRAAGEKGPYLLVGASIGGIFIQAYQRAFPDEVAGLVFTNSTNRVGMSVKGKVGLIWELKEDELRSAFPLPPSAKGPAPTREGEPFDRLSPDLQAVRLWLDVRGWERWDPAGTGPESLLSWRKEFLREFEETDAGKEHSLGKLPVVVLSSNPTASESDRQSRKGAAARLDFLSSNSVHITATGSGHEIHLYQPALVVKAVLRAVSAARNRVPLSRASVRP